MEKSSELSEVIQKHPEGSEARDPDPDCEAQEGDGHLTEAQLLAVNLSTYDRLRTHPTHWQLERDKVLFLQTAVRAGIPWSQAVAGTRTHFGSTLRSPFEPVCAALEPPAYQSPVFDHSLQTPADWAREADRGWRQHRDELLKQIEGPYNELIAAGSLREFDRARVSANPGRRVPILDEATAYKMAAIHYFLLTGFTDLARQYPPSGGWQGNPNQKSLQKRTRANQIRMRVQEILSHLNLIPAQRKQAKTPDCAGKT
jgi:hypothetical protein